MNWTVGVGWGVEGRRGRAGNEGGVGGWREDKNLLLTVCVFSTVVVVVVVGIRYNMIFEGRRVGEVESGLTR